MQQIKNSGFKTIVVKSVTRFYPQNSLEDEWLVTSSYGYLLLVNYTTDLNNIASQTEDKSSTIEILLQAIFKVRVIGGFNWDPD